MKDETLHGVVIRASHDNDDGTKIQCVEAMSRVKGDWHHPPSPTSCSDAVHAEVIAPEERHFDASWEDEWTLEAPQECRRLVAIAQIPLKCRSYEEEEESVVCVRALKRQKTLRLDHHWSDTPSGASSGAVERRRPTKIRFKETVDVVPIPMRSEYSDEMRNQLWSSTMEIQENAARNTIEFASEGWDWRNVTLDDDMCQCTTTGTLIHPIHQSAPNCTTLYHSANDPQPQ